MLEFPTLRMTNIICKNVRLSNRTIIRKISTKIYIPNRLHEFATGFVPVSCWHHFQSYDDYILEILR